MSKKNVKQTNSTLADSEVILDSPETSFCFSLKVDSKILQVQIEINCDSLMIDAMETAIDYLVQLNYDKDINDNIDHYDVFSADQQGNPTKTKFRTNQSLSEIDCSNFALVVKKKGAILSILKQPITSEQKIAKLQSKPQFRYDIAIAK